MSRRVKDRAPMPESQMERDMLAAALRARARWLQENDRITVLAESVSIKAWLLAAIRAATAVYEMSRPLVLTSAGNEGNPAPRSWASPSERPAAPPAPGDRETP